MAIANILGQGVVLGSTGLTRSRSVTVPSGDDRILVVGFSTMDGQHAGGFTSVTYNGVAMTLIDTTIVTDAVGVCLYYLINPPVGTANVVWTNTSQWTAGIYAELVFSGVDQTTPIQQSAEVGGNWVSAPTSVSINAVAGAVAVSILSTTATGTVTAVGTATKVFSGVSDGVQTGAIGYSASGASSFT